MSKARTSFKGILILFIILVAIAGIICAVIFIPKKPEKVKYALNDQSQIVLNDNGEFLKNLNAYKQSASDYLSENPNYNSVFNIFSALASYMTYNSYVFDSADFSNFEKKDINTVFNNLNSAKITATNISNYLADKNISLTQKVGDDYIYGNAEAKLVFENISKDFEKMFGYYANAMEGITKLYQNNVTKGMYSNDFALLSVQASGLYMDYLYKNFGKLNQTDYRFMALKFENLTNNYLKSTDYILEYYTNQEMIAKIEKINGMQNKIENVTLKTIIEAKLSYSTSGLTTEQTEIVSLATTFLKGEIA